ncbi:O-methyltransferase [Siphonobacter sp. SORGH_AS_1065]|uniref:O-methyltransferase n=1 Tax=Siphonobacter sp. SORGH_AS_1065 TaxID=3041795 RepID=UPI002785D0D5|nr:class I SAM-dependent methyltransferase [Siphonobacter sp. SORGH_AS_1065]MDQ1085699.1 caffeoyl-CoA O-methyltransferase [Siphonobacter sp. SORGH_AS_1065]
MFRKLSSQALERMAYLEKLDQQDRTDGTPRSKRLRQINRATGEFLSILAVNAPAGELIEIGTSAGYSTLWLALAARERQQKVKTFEIDPEKIALAQETFHLAGLEEYIEIIPGDFLQSGLEVSSVSFCFLDAEKELYKPCFQLITPKLVTNGLLVADNAIDQYDGIKPMIDAALADERFDCITVPIGNGEFICRRT